MTHEITVEELKKSMGEPKITERTYREPRGAGQTYKENQKELK